VPQRGGLGEPAAATPEAAGSPNEIRDLDVQCASDEVQVRELDAGEPRLDALDGRPPQVRPLGESLLGQVGVLPCLADAVALLLAGTDQFRQVVGHPSKLRRRRSPVSITSDALCDLVESGQTLKTPAAG